MYVVLDAFQESLTQASTKKQDWWQESSDPIGLDKNATHLIVKAITHTQTNQAMLEEVSLDFGDSSLGVNKVVNKTKRAFPTLFVLTNTRFKFYQWVPVNEAIALQNLAQPW